MGFASNGAEQGGAGDGEQRPLVPRSRSSPRLTPGVRRQSHEGKNGTFQNRPKVVDSFLDDSLCIARDFLKTVNWNLKGAEKTARKSRRQGVDSSLQLSLLQPLDHIPA